MKTVTVTITEDGDQIFLNDSNVFCEVGESTVRRASHVVPDDFWRRLAFRAIRACVSDTSRVAEWSRHWLCLWRVDTSPVGGPILPNRFIFRQNAIEAEISFLNQFFLEKNNHV